MLSDRFNCLGLAMLTFPPGKANGERFLWTLVGCCTVHGARGTPEQDKLRILLSSKLGSAGEAKSGSSPLLGDSNLLNGVWRKKNSGVLEEAFMNLFSKTKQKKRKKEKKKKTKNVSGSEMSYLTNVDLQFPQEESWTRNHRESEESLTRNHRESEERLQKVTASVVGMESPSDNWSE